MSIKIEHIQAFPDREKSACHLLLIRDYSDTGYVEIYTWRIVSGLTKTGVVNRVTNSVASPETLPFDGRIVEFLITHKNRAGTVVVESVERP